MDDNELSTKIEDHVRTLANNGTHPLFAKLATKSKVQSALLSNPMVHLGGGAKEYVEIADSLFFFYHPATIVRWPKPVVGELNRFTVRVVPKAQGPLGAGQLNHHQVDGFEGLFRIDKDGTLTIAQQEGLPVTIVALGNPGPELGINSAC